MINVFINGESFSFDAALSVDGIVEKLRLDKRKIAIERNLEIVPRSQYSEILIQDNDRIEIVGFIGGG